MAQKFSIVGQRILKVDGPEITRGKALYSMDEFLPRMLYGKILTSPHAHANISSIDTSKAEVLPGVRAVLTHKDVLPIGIENGAGPGDVKVLDSKVRYVGDEVAAVAADTEEIADEALKLIEVDYEILPAVFDPEEALEPEAPKLYPEYPGGNLITGRAWVNETGDIEQGFLESDRTYEDVFTTFPQAVAPLGRLCAIAWWEGDKLIVIDSTQVPFGARHRLATWLDMPQNKIQVITKYMGTGMGEANVYRYPGIAAYLAKKANRPVKVITDAIYAFVGSPKKHTHGKIYMKAGVKDDGTIMALSAKVIWDKGADGSGGPPPPAVSVIFKGLYDATNQRDEIIGTYTNTPPNGAYRGWGSETSYWALEVFMDRIANDLGIDPLEFRLRRCAAIRSKRPLEIAAERFGWKEKWSPPASKTGTKRRGIGMATLIGWMAGYGIWSSSATIQLLGDGKACLQMGISDIGTGSKTSLTQVAAEVLGMKVEDITIVAGDTNLPPDADGGSSASRVAVNGGTAVYNAAQDLKSKLFNIVAPELGVEPEDLDAEDGEIFVKSSPDKSMTYKEAAVLVAGSVTAYLLGWGTSPNYGFGPFPIEDINPISAQMVEVEVDTETGETTILRMTSVMDVGQCLNRGIVECELVGGMCCGIGYGLTEDIVYDPLTGAILNASYLGYRLPTMLDLPTLDVLPYEDEPNPCTPFGQRGIGEPSLCLPAPAINNAIYNAIGVSSNSNPVTPEKILKLLGKA